MNCKSPQQWHLLSLLIWEMILQLGSVITKINESWKPLTGFWKFGFPQCRNVIPLIKHKQGIWKKYIAFSNTLHLKSLLFENMALYWPFHRYFLLFLYQILDSEVFKKNLMLFTNFSHKQAEIPPLVNLTEGEMSG